MQEAFTGKSSLLFKPIKLIMNFHIKKCCKLDALFTIHWQQDEVALVKTASRQSLLSMCCQMTKVISISFSSFRLNYGDRFRVTVDYHFGSQSSGNFGVPPACTGGRPIPVLLRSGRWVLSPEWREWSR